MPPGPEVGRDCRRTAIVNEMTLVRRNHDGSPAFTDQVLSAVPRQTDTGWRLSYGKSKREIDAAIALVMGLDRPPPRWSQGRQPWSRCWRGVTTRPCLGCRQLIPQ